MPLLSLQIAGLPLARASGAAPPLFEADREKLDDTARNRIFRLVPAGGWAESKNMRAWRSV